jgi:hypothetical protein
MYSERRKKTRKWNLQCSKTKMELKSKCERIEKNRNANATSDASSS